MADDEEDAWGSELDGKAQPNVGASKDVLRKARQLNPALAAQGSTTELFSKIKGTEQAASASANPSAGAASAGGGSLLRGSQDFATAFYDGQKKFKDEKKRIQDEIVKLQKQLQELGPRALDKLIDLIIDIDPNMMSPQTQEILKTETAHLNEIGFSVRRVIDRKMKKK